MFTLRFSHNVNGKRVPFLVDGAEATLHVEADSKTAAINHPDTASFCALHEGTAVRSVE